MKLFKMFRDNSAAEKCFAKARWPEGTHCPHCESVNVQSGAAHKSMPYRCRERECHERFSIHSRTCMDASNLGFQIWAIAVYLMSTSLKGVSSMKLHRDLGITQKSAWHLAMRLRKALEDDGVKLPFAGPVEADETYIGGKERNKHVKNKLKAGRDREVASRAPLRPVLGTGHGPPGRQGGGEDRRCEPCKVSWPSTLETGAQVYTDDANA